VLDGANPDEFRTEETRKNDARVIGSYQGPFLANGFRLSAAQVDRIVQECETNQYLTVRKMAAMMHELGNRMEDESSSLIFLSLTPSEAALFQPDNSLFGADVENKLSQVIADISEAGKCLGLQRPTAAVFHLMRVMEVGVQKFGDKLGVALADEKNWQVILDQVNPPIKAMGKSPDAVRCASIAANLFNVKLAWRNEVMHPKATYTPEEAENIFRCVRTFMNDLVWVL
jgi:hypothetical protein